MAFRAQGSVGSTVLVVEDDESLLFAVSSALDAAGFDVKSVLNGQLGLDFLETEPVDVMVVDVRLGRLSGVDVLRAVKARWPDIEVIMMTGSTEFSLAVECLRAGAFDFVVKPFEMVQLQTSISRAVERKALRETTSLYRASQGLLGVKDAAGLPERIVGEICRALHADDASLLSVVEDGRLRVLFGSAIPAHPDSFPVADRVMRDGRPTIITGRLHASARFADLRDHGRVASAILIPLSGNKGCVGVLNVNRRKAEPPFRERDVERAVVLASQATLALENARLMRELVSTERLAAIGELVAGVTHEINNPVSYVLTNLQFLTDHLQAAEASKRPLQIAEVTEVLAAARDALDGAERIKALTRDLMGMARSDAADELIDIETPLRAALRVSASALRVCKSVVVDTQEGFQVRADAGRLAQVFTNLLVNAAHAVEEAPPDRRHVKVSSFREGITGVVRIADSGAGISAGVAGRIFEPFFTTKPSGKGTGLGLPLSRDIVASFGGELRVTNAESGGAVFEVVLPLVRRATGHAGPPR